MSTQDLQQLVHNFGKRLRKIAESRDWQTPEMRPMRDLFGEFAAGGRGNTDVLRRLIAGVGSRELDVEALQSLAPDDARYFWRGYYGALRYDPSDCHPAGVA